MHKRREKSGGAVRPSLLFKVFLPPQKIQYNVWPQGDWFFFVLEYSPSNSTAFQHGLLNHNIVRKLDVLLNHNLEGNPIALTWELPHPRETFQAQNQLEF